MKKLLSLALLCSVFILAGCIKDAPGEPGKDPVNNKRVRILYVIPSDRSLNRIYLNAIKVAAPILQYWYKDQMDGKTYLLNNPLVETLQSDKTANWFSANNGSISGTEEQFYFFFNTYTEVTQLLGDNWDLSKYAFTIYVDAYGQTGAGSTGFCIMPENDLKGLSGQMPEPVSRWIGGWGHELGHAFGLPHPDGSPYFNEAIMGAGYLIFPDCFLLESDKATLLNSGFFY